MMYLLPWLSAHDKVFYMCDLASYALCMDMYVFWDDDAMLYA